MANELSDEKRVARSLLPDATGKRDVAIVWRSTSRISEERSNPRFLEPSERDALSRAIPVEIGQQCGERMFRQEVRGSKGPDHEQSAVRVVPQDMAEQQNGRLLRPL